MASSSLDGCIKLFDLLEARPIYDLRGHDKGATAVKFNANGNYIASGGNDKLVFLWKTNIDTADREMRQGAVRESQSEIGQKVTKVKKEISKANALAERQRAMPSGGGENKENITDDFSHIVKENEKVDKEKESLRVELVETKEKLSTLMETVILMEKRITLLEDQVKLSSSLNATEVRD